jgi:hypothetical protein
LALFLSSARKETGGWSPKMPPPSGPVSLLLLSLESGQLCDLL